MLWWLAAYAGMIVPVVIDHNDSGCAAASSLDDLPMRISFLSSIKRLIVLVVCMVYGIWWSICLRSLLLRVHLNRNKNYGNRLLAAEKASVISVLVLDILGASFRRRPKMISHTVRTR